MFVIKQRNTKWSFEIKLSNLLDKWSRK